MCGFDVGVIYVWLWRVFVVCGLYVCYTVPLYIPGHRFICGPSLAVKEDFY